MKTLAVAAAAASLTIVSVTGAPPSAIARMDDGRIFKMPTKREATVDDLYHVAAKKAELVNGELVVVSPRGPLAVDVLREHVVRVYRAADPATPTVYRRGDRAEAEPALAGWSMPVDDLFPR